MQMSKSFEAAKRLLSEATRSELRDHAFGDVEIYWSIDGQPVAEGFFGGGPGCGICVFGGGLDCEFDGREAVELRKFGKLGAVERNDSTGPDRYQEGTCMPGLTLDGVRDELIAAGVFVPKAAKSAP